MRTIIFLEHKYLLNFGPKTLLSVSAGTTEPHRGEHLGKSGEDFDTVVDVGQVGLDGVGPVLGQVGPQLGLDVTSEHHQLLAGLALLQLDADEDPGEDEDDPVCQEAVLRFTGGEGPVDVQLLQFRSWHAGDHRG